MQRVLFGEAQEKKDAMERFEKKFQEKDPLLALKAAVDWSIFEDDLRKFRKSLHTHETGRPPFSPALMFKILVLQSLYNLSDEATEFIVQDRLSFMRFLDLKAGDRVPDARTIWYFRNELSKADMVEYLFSRFNEHLKNLGLLPQKGQIIDASFVEVPKQRLNAEEKESIADGKRPEGWSDAKASHKDCDATWAKKNSESHFGYKNNIQVDAETKVIARYSATTASVHDSQIFEELLETPEAQTADASAEVEAKKGEPTVVYADKAYRSETNEELLKKHGMKSRVLHRAARNRPLTETEKSENRINSRIRCRVEHVFGMQKKMIGDLTLHAVGYMRIRALIGLRNLCYNMTRLVFFTKKGVVCQG